MKKIRNQGMGMKLIIMLMIACIPIGLYAHEASKQDANKVEIIFTHDLHSHLESFRSQTNKGEQDLGGFARIKGLIETKKAQNEDLLVIDAGDFSMGTLYQTIFESEASEIRMLGNVGFAATTLGNHEFDYDTEGLTKMLQSAVEKGEQLPELVLCNVDWEKSLQGEYAEENRLLKQALDAYGVKPYTMIEKNGVKIALIGVFGKQSFKFSPTCTLTFEEPVKAVKETVETIKANEKADMIICLSHSGTWEDIKKSEDEQLALQVPEIDLIISGHTHTKLEQPIIHGNTTIASCGEYGKYIGNLSMIPNGERWQVENYELIAMDDTVQEDESIKEALKEYDKQINENYLAQFGYTKNQVLCYNTWQYPALKEMEGNLREQPFANLMADSYLYTMEQIGQKQKDEVMISVVPMGVIRDTFACNKEITVSNVYDAFSLGKGRDGISGYPLICVYLTGKEIKLVAEIDASMSKLMSTAQLFISGLSYKINPNRLILNKVTEVKLMDEQGKITQLEDEKLYPVVTDLYSGRMLGSVTDMSYGLLSIIPKDGNGAPIKNLNDAIVQKDGKEVKAWTAIARYLESFKEGDEVPVIPAYYNEVQGRKVIVNDKHFAAVWGHPNTLILKIGGILVGGIVILIGSMMLIVKKLKKIRNSSAERGEKA